MQSLALTVLLAATTQVSDSNPYRNPPQSAATASELTLADPATTAPTPADPPAQTPAEVQPVAIEPATSAAAAAESPVSSQPPAEQRSVLTPFVKPSDLMRQLMKPPAAGALSGSPLTLGEAVRTARDRKDQTARAKAYWELAAAVGDFNVASLELTELGVLSQSVGSPSSSWNAKLTEARNRVALTRSAAESAQLRVRQLVGDRNVAPLPLPADAPHCGRYNAEYDEIFGDQPNPVAKQLSELMPMRYAELRNQAQAVADAAAWRDDASRRLDPATGGIELLQAQELLSLKRRAFIAMARDYNDEIAQYTELAAPATVAPDRLVAMMIRTSVGDGDLPWQSSGVQQATAEQQLPPDVAALPKAGAGPATAAAPPAANSGYREVRRPLQRLLDRNREHSIVSGIRRLRQRIE
jgi:hypothetical protein